MTIKGLRRSRELTRPAQLHRHREREISPTQCRKHRHCVGVLDSMQGDPYETLARRVSSYKEAMGRRL